MKIRTLLLVIVILSGTVSCNKSETTAPDTLTMYFNAGTIPSAIMGSVDAKGTTHIYAFGPSIWGGNDVVTPDHIFRIYSMTKAIASVAAMQLVEQGKLTLDGSLNELMPEMASIPILNEDGTLVLSSDPITLRQLLTHTAGFAYTFTSSRLSTFKPDKWEYKDYPRIFKPGTGWNYGTSTDWVGRVIEKVSGKDLETYLRENVTGPLKMESTWFNVPVGIQDKIVSWGSRDSTGVIKEEYPRIPEKTTATFSAGGGLFSSMNDYLRFLQCMLNYGELNGVRILKKETVESMLRDNLPAGVNLHYEKQDDPDSLFGGHNDEKDRWGLAWAIETNPDEKTRAQGAVYWAGAANSYYTLDLKNKIAVVYFTQFFPFNDRESHNFYRLFEKEVYGNGAN